MMSTRFLTLAMAACLSFTSSVMAQVTLVDKGQPRAVLVIPEQAIPEEKIAAEEIQLHIERMSGAKLAIVTPGQEQGLAAVRIGRAAPPSLAQRLGQATKDQSAFVLKVDASEIAFTGLINDEEAAMLHELFKQPVRQLRNQLREIGYTDQGKGTTIAAYELLEQLGVRWYAPGDWGLVVPRKDTIIVAAQDKVHQPVIRTRLTATTVKHDRVWDRRMRQGGPNFPSSHGLPGIGHTRDYLKEHPEWGSLNDGERRGRQVCISNPQVIEHVAQATREYFRRNPWADIIGMGANDGRGFCECDNCRALDGGDYDALGGYESMTDRYIWLFNQILDRIKDEFPDKRIGFYAYSVYNRPPVKVIPNRRIVPAVALITLCRLHGMDNPICPESQYQQRIIRQWGKLVDEVYDRGYWFNLSDPGLPFFILDRVRTEIPLGYKLGLRGWRVETNPSWGSETPSLYIASKLLWNPEADVDAMLQEFYTLFFGPAARPMQQYIEMLSKRLNSADHHTGAAWDMPFIYDASVRKAAVDALAQAQALATEEPYAARVKAYADCWRYFELFTEVIESRWQHDYAASMKALTELEALQKQLRAATPPMINVKFEEYMNRFYNAATKQGYACVTGENQFIAGLLPTWQFLLDPGNIGVDINLWDHHNTGGNWQTIDARTSWGNQGLRHYKGIVWYRQSVEIPASAKGRRLFLWFAGVDEAATVWVNSKLVGASAKGTFKPFDLDITPYIKAGERNTIIVRLANETLNELGTGGIVGPVMIYAPGNPEAKPTGGVPDQKIVEDMETIGGE